MKRAAEEQVTVAAFVKGFSGWYYRFEPIDGTMTVEQVDFLLDRGSTACRLKKNPNMFFTVAPREGYNWNGGVWLKERDDARAIDIYLMSFEKHVRGKIKQIKKDKEFIEWLKQKKEVNTPSACSERAIS